MYVHYMYAVRNHTFSKIPGPYFVANFFMYFRIRYCRRCNVLNSLRIPTVGLSTHQYSDMGCGHFQIKIQLRWLFWIIPFQLNAELIYKIEDLQNCCYNVEDFKTLCYEVIYCIAKVLSSFFWRSNCLVGRRNTKTFHQFSTAHIWADWFKIPSFNVAAMFRCFGIIVLTSTRIRRILEQIAYFKLFNYVLSNLTYFLVILTGLKNSVSLTIS